MRSFANVGKALLIQAVGIQDNYIEEVTDVIDTEKSGCSDCPHSFYPDKEACSMCEHKCYLTKKIYHNEKNKYGTKNRLKANALKILLCLHFLRPDQNGIVKNVNLKELAEHLDCSLRTVTNNLSLLKDSGYVYYTTTCNGRRNILITDYKDNFLKAEEGGKGYVVLNKAFLDKILAITNITTLRIHLRNMVELDNLNKNGKSGINVVSKSYKKLQRELPTYCKRGVIKKALTGEDGIFYIKHDASSGEVRFSLNDAYIGKKSRAKEIDSTVHSLKKYIDSFNDALFAYEEDKLDSSSIFYDLLERVSSRGYWQIRTKDLINIAQLADYYSYDIIEQAMTIAYEKYLLEDGKVSSYGAVIRTIAQKLYAYMEAA